MRVCVLLLISSVCLTFSDVRAQRPDTLETKHLNEIFIRSSRIRPGIERLPAIDGTNIWSGKKNEVIQVAAMDANITEKTGRQIFAKIPGVFVYDMDGSGNQVNVSTRGLDPHRGWEFNIRKNGVITNSDMYGYPASHYSMPMEAIERINVVRGTGSLQYGAQFGGMMNYVTKRGDTTKAVGFESINSVGSFGLMSTYNAIGGKVGKFQYYVYYNRRNSNGYRANASTQSEAASAIVSYAATRDLRITAEVGRSTYTYRIPGPLTDDMFNADPRQATRSRNYFNPDIYIPSITIDWIAGRNTKLSWTTSAVLGARNSVMFDKPANIVDAIDPVTLQYAPRQVDIDHFNSFTSEFKLLQHYRLFNRDHVLTAGFQVFDNDLHRQQLGKGTTGSDFDLTLVEGFQRDLHFKTKNVALFVENSFRVNEKLTVNPGVRIEIGESKMTGTIAYYDQTQLPNSISHNFPLFGINSQYQLNASQNLYAGIAQSYRPVIFKDIIPASTYEVVDKNLKDAHGYTVEAGYRGRHKNLHWDIGVFQMQYNNRLGSVSQTDAGGNYVLFRTNIGNSVTRGAEIFAEQGFGLGKVDVSVFTSTALFDARYQDAAVKSGNENINVSGNKIESVPDVITRNGIATRYGLASISVLYSYTAASYADALNTSTPSATGAVGLVPAYGLLDINTTFRFGSNVTMKLNLNNVMNQQYFTKRPQFYPGPGVWSSDGRSIVVTLGFKV